MLRRPKKLKDWTAVIAAAISILIYAQQQGLLSDAGQKLQTAQPGFYRITRFVDGDTLEIDMNGKTEKVRFIGVDTPETHKPNTPVQCYGPAASAFTKNTIGTQSIRLEADALSSNRDRYNRLLRYVYLPDGTLMNQKLIEEGYGFYYPYFPFTKSTQFSFSQQNAKQSNKGLWKNCSPTQTDKGGYVSNPAV